MVIVGCSRYSKKKDTGNVLLKLVLDICGVQYKRSFLDVYRRYQSDDQLTGGDIWEVASKFIIDYGLRGASQQPKQKHTPKTRGRRNKALEQAFNQMIVTLFERMGYRVLKTKGSHDFGADLVLERFGRKTAVQLKCRTRNVGVSAVQEVVAARRYWGLSGCRGSGHQCIY